MNLFFFGINFVPVHHPARPAQAEHTGGGRTVPQLERTRGDHHRHGPPHFFLCSKTNKLSGKKNLKQIIKN